MSFCYNDVTAMRFGY